MSRINVTIGPPSPAGALEPRYDRESQILAAESPVAAEWPFGVDIDGRLVFDLAGDRTLMNLDLHIAASRWVKDSEVQWPSSGRPGVLVFDAGSVAEKSFHLPLEVKVDPGSQVVLIEIGDMTGAQPVRLSNDCVALVTEGALAGFVLRLE